MILCDSTKDEMTPNNYLLPEKATLKTAHPVPPTAYMVGTALHPQAKLFFLQINNKCLTLDFLLKIAYIQYMTICFGYEQKCVDF